MKIHDITLTMTTDMPVWPGNPPVELSRASSMDVGAHDNVTHLGCHVHSGTHVDAPHHFLNDHRTVEDLALDVLVGPVYVAQIPDGSVLITAETLNEVNIPSGTTRLLLKTSNSMYWRDGEKEFIESFVGISLDGAEWIVRAGIRLIGIDYLSIAPYKQGGPTHIALLKPGIIILEGLDLSGVLPGAFDLFCLPLKLAGSDGAPARVILIET